MYMNLLNRFCSPESADICQIPVKDGDVILLATDGVFDNLPDYLIVSELSKVCTFMKDIYFLSKNTRHEKII